MLQNDIIYFKTYLKTILVAAHSHPELDRIGSLQEPKFYSLENQYSINFSLVVGLSITFIGFQTNPKPLTRATPRCPPSSLPLPVPLAAWSPGSGSAYLEPGWSAAKEFPNAWEDQKGRSSLGLQNLHHKRIRAQNGGIYFLDPPGLSG